MSDIPESNIPDPNGPPQPARIVQRPVFSILRVAGTCIVGGLAAFLVLGVTSTRTMGALRSHRLTLQQRKDEIAQAQADSDHAAQPTEQTHE